MCQIGPPQLAPRGSRGRSLANQNRGDANARHAASPRTGLGLSAPKVLPGSSRFLPESSRCPPQAELEQGVDGLGPVSRRRQLVLSWALTGSKEAGHRIRDTSGLPRVAYPRPRHQSLPLAQGAEASRCGVVLPAAPARPPDQWPGLWPVGVRPRWPSLAKQRPIPVCGQSPGVRGADSSGQCWLAGFTLQPEAQRRSLAGRVGSVRSPALFTLLLLEDEAGSASLLLAPHIPHSGPCPGLRVHAQPCPG